MTLLGCEQNPQACPPGFNRRIWEAAQVKKQYISQTIQCSLQAYGRFLDLMSVGELEQMDPVFFEWLRQNLRLARVLNQATQNDLQPSTQPDQIMFTARQVQVMVETQARQLNRSQGALSRQATQGQAPGVQQSQQHYMQSHEGATLANPSLHQLQRTQQQRQRLPHPRPVFQVRRRSQNLQQGPPSQQANTDSQ